MLLSAKLSSQKRSILLVASLALLTFLSFSPVLKAQFLNWDDDVHLTNNAHVLSFSLPHIKALFRQHINDNYIPLTSLSFSLEHRFFGLNPFVYHLDNLLLHMAVVILVFFFARNLGLNTLEAFLGALIFALHPTKVESVAWVTERKDMLYGVFYMASLICYQKGRFWGSIVFCFLSILAKPTALSLPLIMILLDWFNGRGVNVKTIVSKWPYFLVVAAIGWLTYKTQVPIPWFNIEQYLLIWAWTFVFYIKKFFIPLGSIPIYILPKPINLFSIAYGAPLLVFLALMGGVWLGRKSKFIIFAFAFYVLSIFFLPRFNMAADTNMVADRFAYLPSLGFCLLIALAISRVYQFLTTQEIILRHLFSTAVMALIVGLILLSYNQSIIWHDSISLWKYQLRISPHPLAYNNLAVALRDSNDYQQALNDYRVYSDQAAQGANENKASFDRDKLKKVEELVDLYKQAIAIDRQNVVAYFNLADLYQAINKFDEAIVWYNKALGIDSKNKDAFFGLGLLYQRMNKHQQAMEIFGRLLKAYPDDENVCVNVMDVYSKAIANYPQEKQYQQQREEILSAYEQLSKRKKYSAVDYFNLGFLYEQVGGYEEAIRYYKKALEIKPSYDKALYNLANRYQEMGEFKIALVLYQRLLHDHPRYALGYLNMGVIYGSLGDAGRARMLYQKTLDVDPTNAGAYFNLGFLSESAGNLKEALNYYEKAVDNDPHLAEGYYNIGNVYAALGQNDEAIASYLKTVGINKNHQDAFVNLSILSFKSGDITGARHYLEEAKALGYNPPAEYLRSLESYQKNAT